MSDGKELKIFKQILPYIIASLKGILVFGTGFSLISLIMYKFNFNNPIIYFLLYIFLMLSGFVCGVSAYKKKKGRGFLTGTFGAIPLAVIVSLFSAVFSAFSISSNILLITLLCLSGGFLGGITAVNTRI